MHTKILRPQSAGKIVYANTGSAKRLVNYLEHEAKELKQRASFFGAAGKENPTADEVVSMMDNNHEGLRKEDRKFHSVVLAPSQEQAALLGNDSKQWQQYTRQSMDLYAKNFKLSDGKELGEENLVWAATIHQERKNKGTDAGLQGKPKLGIQTHVHVLISARDAEHQVTLNPWTNPARFNRTEFYAQTNVLLEQQLGQRGVAKINTPVPSWEQRVAEKVADIKERAAANKKQLTPTQVAAKDARLDTQIAKLNTKLSPDNQLEGSQVKAVAKELNYNAAFYATLKRIERNADKGTFTPQPYDYLRTGLVARIGTVPEASSQVPSQREYSTPVPREQPARPTIARKLEHLVSELSAELEVKIRASKVPAVVENPLAVSAISSETALATAPEKPITSLAEPAPFATPLTDDLTSQSAAKTRVPDAQSEVATPLTVAPLPETGAASPVVHKQALLAEQAVEPSPAGISTAVDLPSTVEEKLLRSEDEGEELSDADCDAWDDAYERYQELLEQTTRKIELADQRTYRSLPDFVSYMQAQELDLLPATAEQAAQVVDRQSGQKFPAADILLNGEPFLERVAEKVTLAAEAAKQEALIPQIDWQPRYELYNQERERVWNHNRALGQVIDLVETNPNVRGVTAAIKFVQDPGTPELAKGRLLPGLQAELVRQEAWQEQARGVEVARERLQKEARGRFGLGLSKAASEAQEQLERLYTPPRPELQVLTRYYLETQSPALSLQQFAQQQQAGLDQVRRGVDDTLKAPNIKDWQYFKSFLESWGVEGKITAAGKAEFKHVASGQTYQASEVMPHFNQRFNQALERGLAHKASQPQQRTIEKELGI